MASTLHAYPHGSSSHLVSEAERQRATDFLQQAYVQQRLDEGEFDARVGVVVGARTRADLDRALAGLRPPSMTAFVTGTNPAYRPLVNMHADGGPGRATAAFAHFSPFVTLLLGGPALVHMLTRPGTFARREAAKVLNFQMLVLIGAVALVLGDGAFAMIRSVWHVPLPSLGPLFPLGAVVWFLLTIVGGVKAGSGESWRNPLTRWTRFRPFDED